VTVGGNADYLRPHSRHHPRDAAWRRHRPLDQHASM